MPRRETSRSVSLCQFCRAGQWAAARVSVVTRWAGTACEVTGVPADVCMECGRYTLAPAILTAVQALLEEDIPSAVTPGKLRLAYRQRRVRVDLPGMLQGPRELHSDVQVINLTEDGALIGHAVQLSPGESCVLRLRVTGADLPLAARVIWCRVSGPSQSPAGAVGPPLRSGLRFADIPEAAKAQVGRYLAALRPRGKRPVL